MKQANGPPGPVELTLPPGVDAAGVLDRLGRHVRLEAGTVAGTERVLLDTFDGLLRAAGLSAEHRPAADGAVRLTVGERGAPAGTVELVPERPDRVLAAELPESAVRHRLAAVTEGRALLPQARLRSRLRPVQVLNRDAKTVARLVVEEPAVVVAGGPPIVLAPRVHLRPVRGYDRTWRRVRRLLEDEGLEARGDSLFDEAVAAVGGRPGGVSAKVDVALAPGLAAGEAVAAVNRRLVEIAEANLEGVRTDLDPEFLHDLRVAVRRARSVLRELKRALPDARRRELAAELRWVQQVTGPVRDLDVELEAWPGFLARLPPEGAADLAPVHGVLARHRADARRRLLADLADARFAAALDRWRSLGAPAGPPGDGEAEPPDAVRPIADVAGGRIRALYRRMVAEGRRIDDGSPAEALHDLRKQGKELRYLLEHFGRLWPSESKGLIATLKGLQDVLGRFQDRQVQAAHLRALAPEVAGVPGGPEAILALAAVIDGLAHDSAAARADFARRFAAFSSAGTRRLVERIGGP